MVTICFTLLSMVITAQEFLMQVDVNVPTLQTADPSLFKTLESRLTEFLNNRRWTNETYKEHERIKGNINLTITSELSSTAFAAELKIQAIRPVYGTSYETTLLNHQDNEFVFQFEQNTPLNFADNIFTDNLTSVFAFYMYYILGLDHDSFALYGGDPYYEAANEIINTLPSNLLTDNKSGWSSQANGRNRYFMIENILSPRTRPFRKALYEYHRQGIDVMYKDAEQGKLVIIESLKELQTVTKDYPNSMIIQMFANAKAQEVTDIFAVATRPQKNEVYQIMTSIDPANRNKYLPIRR